MKLSTKTRYGTRAMLDLDMAFAALEDSRGDLLKAAEIS